MGVRVMGGKAGGSYTFTRRGNFREPGKMSAREIRACRDASRGAKVFFPGVDDGIEGC